jgi:hypothetical protein
MRDLQSQKECELKLKEFQALNPDNKILMIDGHSIDIFMSLPSLESDFFQTST